MDFIAGRISAHTAPSHAHYAHESESVRAIGEKEMMIEGICRLKVENTVWRMTSSAGVDDLDNNRSYIYYNS